MKYEKLTFKNFKKKLSEGGYESATGARRAVGKCQDWSEADKKKARGSIDSHFGASATPPKAAKKTSKTSKKRAVKKTKAKAAKKTKAAKVAKKVAKKTTKRSPRQSSNTSDDIFENNPLAAINITNGVTGTAGQVLEAMRLAKAAYPDLDITEGVQATYDALTAAMKGVNRQTQEAFGSPDDEAPKVEETKSANGTSEVARVSAKVASPPPLQSAPTAQA